MCYFKNQLLAEINKLKFMSENSNLNSAESDSKTLMKNFLYLLHSMKGTCGFLKLNNLSNFIHEIETFFKKGYYHLNKEALDFIARTVSLNMVSDNFIDCKKGLAELEKFLIIKSDDSKKLETTVKPYVDKYHIEVEKDEVLSLIDYSIQLNRMTNEFYKLKDSPDVVEITSSLNELIINKTIVPFNYLASKFTDVILTLATSLGKEADLKIIGGETLVDITLLDKLYQSLLHIIMNAVCHGIESPDYRTDINKYRRGTVILSCEMVMTDVVIKVINDGAMIDKNKVFSKALSLEICDENIDKDKILNLLFYEGMSTSKVVDIHSGRGIGLSAVAKVIEELNGTIDITSRHSETIFTIKVSPNVIVDTCCIYETDKGKIAFLNPPLDGKLKFIKKSTVMIKLFKSWDLINKDFLGIAPLGNNDFAVVVKETNIRKRTINPAIIFSFSNTKYFLDINYVEKIICVDDSTELSKFVIVNKIDQILVTTKIEGIAFYCNCVDYSQEIIDFDCLEINPSNILDIFSKAANDI